MELRPRPRSTPGPALDAMDVSDPAGEHPSILPEPASPFLVSATNSASSSARITPAPGLPHIQLDQHLNPLVGSPPSIPVATSQEDQSKA